MTELFTEILDGYKVTVPATLAGRKKFNRDTAFLGLDLFITLEDGELRIYPTHGYAVVNPGDVLHVDDAEMDIKRSGKPLQWVDPDDNEE